MSTLDILEKLIELPTVSSASNLELIHYVSALLERHGVASRIIPNADGTKANLLATVGPADQRGIVLSGHTDVVPVEGQAWSVPPFAMTARDGRLFGRGTADMKGFVACALTACIKAARMNLRTPLHLALSHDEEVGCRGVGSLIEELRKAPQKPLLCIVGEPTGMAVATGHKGKLAARVVCKGRTAHSALAPRALNAIHLGCDFVTALRNEQARIIAEGARDDGYEVPYTTVHAGMMHGGVALNIVPDQCLIEFEIRNISSDDPETIMERIRAQVAPVIAAAARSAPEADIAIEVVNAYPDLDTDPTSATVGFVNSMSGMNMITKVPFGTEAGLFARDAGIPTVICGPGFMDQGHKPDEFIAAEQLARCDNMLEKLIDRMQQGVNL